jgi:EAL domain-containing protein (putative c-di-GMP-specific phosphodiesterase class I)
MPAGKVIEAAEDSGTVTIIDKWVFKTILEWLSTHEAQLTRTKVVSVNLSGVSINDDRFIEWLFGLLGRYGHLASRLCVEITEGVALQNFERTQKFITRLQAMGVRIALDDFGAGYTSFSYLKELRADAIKIDGTLIRGMMSCETSIAVVRTIVELARNLGMKSIVEWVEDADTLRALQEMGADYAQGWAISAARPTVDILNAKSIVDLAGPDILDVVARSTDQPDDDNTWSLPPQQLSSAGGT